MLRLFRHLFTGDNLVTTLCLAVVLTAIVRLLAGCHHEAKPKAPAPRMVVERRPCLEQPPPEPMPGAVVYDGGGKGDCDPAYIMCLPREGAVQLIAYLSAIHDWARDAFTSCGPTPVPAPTGGVR